MDSGTLYSSELQEIRRQNQLLKTAIVGLVCAMLLFSAVGWKRTADDLEVKHLTVQQISLVDAQGVYCGLLDATQGKGVVIVNGLGGGFASLTAGADGAGLIVDGKREEGEHASLAMMATGTGTAFMAAGTKQSPPSISMSKAGRRVWMAPAQP